MITIGVDGKTVSTSVRQRLHEPPDDAEPHVRGGVGGREPRGSLLPDSEQINVKHQGYGFFGVMVAPASAGFGVLVLGVDCTVMLLVTLVAPQRLAN